VLLQLKLIFELLLLESLAMTQVVNKSPSNRLNNL